MQKIDVSVWVILIAAIIAAIPPTIAAIASLIIALRTHETSLRTHEAVNGRMTDMLEMAKKTSKSEGVAEGMNDLFDIVEKARGDRRQYSTAVRAEEEEKRKKGEL
jgi:hypothetical protein